MKAMAGTVFQNRYKDRYDWVPIQSEALRIMLNFFAMVQAIGTAAAMAVELKKEIRPLHIQDLHE